MKKNHFLSLMTIICISINGYSQVGDPHIENATNELIKTETKKTEASTESEIPKKVIPKVDKNNSDNYILFREDFSSEEWKKNWQYNSRSNYISVVNDRTYGKVLKISKESQSGNCFLKKDITSLVRGKKIMIKSLIKYDNIQGGHESYEIGNLSIELTVDGKIFYPAVQDLVGYSDWKEHYVRQDGTTDIDNTINGEYVIFIPEKTSKVILYFGLQNCSGSIFFSNIEITEIP